MFYTPKNDFTNFATMKKIALFVFLLLIAVISFGQTVPVQAKTLRVNWGSDNYSINLNGDSVLIDASDFIWFAKKFGSDTLLFGDGTYMTTAPASGGTDTGYVKTTGDSLFGTFSFSNGSYFDDYEFYFKDGLETASFAANGISLNNGAGINSYITNRCLKIQGNSRACYIGLNGLTTLANDTSLADDGSIVYDVVAAWGEVYVFNSKAIDQWAEFIISPDGSVYLKSNSTDVVTTDTDNKLCIIDNDTGFTIRNRLGGARTIKYIIHH